MPKFSGLAFFWLLISCGSLWAQNSSSPYSRYGLGDLGPLTLTSQLSTGNTGTAQTSPWSLNLANPASHAYFLPKSIFNVGVISNTTNISNGVQEQSFNNTYFSNISLGMNVSKRWGMSFGLLPFSHVGYTMVDSADEVGIGNVQYRFEGDGGLQRFYFGNGVKVWNKNDSASLSLGVNMNYIFGNLNHDRTVLMPTGFYHSSITETWSVRDFAWEFGLLYRNRFTDKFTLTLGGTYGLANNLRTNRDYFVRTFDLSSLNTAVIKDTIDFVEDEEGFLRFPMYHRYGMMLEFNQKWKISVDYRLQEWGSFFSSFDSAGTDQLTNSSRIAAGLEFVPQSRVMVNANLFKMARYRIGWHHETSSLRLNNTEITDSGISFGVGFPLVKSLSMSSLNIGARVGRRGSLQNGLAQENYFLVSVGLSLSPNKRDRWFVKRKID